MGDERTYAYLVGIRAVTSSDGMTSDWYKMPYEVLEKISNNGNLIYFVVGNMLNYQKKCKIDILDL